MTKAEMTNSTTRGSDENLAPFDPLLELAKAIAAADARVQEYGKKGTQARKIKDGVAETYLENAERHACDQYYSLREGLSCHEATTMEGAMIQVAEAYNLVDRLWDIVPEGDHDREGKKIKRSIERLLISSLRMMERVAEKDLSSLGLACFRSAHLDPWEDVELRIAAVKKAL